MANHLTIPRDLVFESDSATSVKLTWSAVDGATGYELRGAGSRAVRSVTATEAIVRGLVTARNETMAVRATDGIEYSDWAEVQIRATASIPLAPALRAAIPLIDTDRQAMTLRLPNVNGQNVDVQLSVWWSPTDNGWWGSIEVPVNTPAVSSRRLGLNCGILDAIGDVLSGNIVMRSTGDANVIEEEPTRGSIASGTHALFWEPNE